MGRRTQPTRPIAGRRRWLAASSLAMATAILAAQSAHAQVTPIAAAGQGTVTVQSGTVAAGTFDGVRTVTQEPRTGGLRDTITIASNEVVLLWNPVDTNSGGGDILFLGRNDAIRFQRDGSTYTVINRVIPTDQTRAIRFEGLVESYINSGVYGGNVFFYSPGGIVVGSTGRFDVGSLVLTSLDVTQNISTTTTLDFAPATQADSKVRIDPWTTGPFDSSSQIDTFGGGNAYVALVAPTVEQLGRVNSAGNIAYVAAEEATMTITGSLFDIVVKTGTTSTTGVEHGADAVTTGSAYGGPSRRIQMVAVPKNDALTMLVSGSVGYQQASSVGIVNGRIVLTAGTPGDADADLEIGEASFGQSVTATATGDIRIAADGAGASIAVDDGMNALDFTATAGGNISVDLTNGAGMNVSGNMSLKAGSGDTGGDIAIKADAIGVIAPTSSNGLDIGGNLTLNSSAAGVSNFATGGIATDAVAGDISITLAQGAQFSVGGNLTVDAFAQAGFGDLQSGDATGGSVTIDASGAGGAFNVTGDTDIDAGARAAFSLVDGGPSAGETGGDAAGGNVSLAFNGIDTTFGGALLVSTSARASSGRNAAIVQDNAARAGDIALSFTGGTHDLFYLDLGAVGSAGLSFDGAGNGVAGTVGRALVDIALDGAAVTTGDDNTIDASTSGNISASAAADAVRLTAINGASLASSYFEARATHDNVDSTNPGTAGGIAVTADSSTLELGSLTLQTNALASSSVAADKSGGSITVSASNGSLITASGATLSSGVNEPIDAVGPSVNTGGAISLIAVDSDIAFTGGAQLDSSVDVSRGGDGSDAPSTGGAITILQTGVDSDLTFNSLSLSTAAALPDGGSNDFLGNGGNAAGGTVTVDVQGGNFTADSLVISTFAVGQTGGSQIAAPGDFAGDGGSARSGDILVTAAGASFDPGVVFLSNTASGGTGGTGLSSLGAAGAGAGGAAEGGAVVFDLLAGTVDLEAFFVILPPIEVIGPFLPPSIPSFDFGSIAVGGTGGFGDGTPGGAGGAATGGTATFNSAGADVTVSTAAVGVFSGAYGGAGGDSQFNSDTSSYGGPAGAGGTATGGTATYLFTGGTTNVTAALVDASAFGGIGGNHVGFSGGPLSAGGIGGSAFGGTATITIGADDASSALYTVTARATGGDGGDGPFAGAGGDAEGGKAQFNVANAGVNAYSIDIDASAYGGDGGYPGRTGAPGGAGGNATGGSAGIDVFGLSSALTTEQGIDITSTGTGGEGGRGGYLGDGGAGGYGRGGSILIAARDGASLELLTTNVVDARGRGGDGGQAGGYDGNPPGAGGNGGAGYGGSIEVHASGATLTASSVGGPVQFSAAGTGGLGGSSGYSGYYGYYGSQGTPGANGALAGGSVSLGSFEGGLFQVNGDLEADASAIGRVDTRTRSTGSDATGGAVRLDIATGGAFVVTGIARLEATALATLGRDTIGNAVGGTVDVTMAGADSSLQVGNFLTIDVSAFEPISTSTVFTAGPGGNTIGGAVTVDLSGGTTTVSNELLISASAGDSTPRSSSVAVTNPAPGSATGGRVDLAFTGGSHTFGQTNIDIAASAPGGQATAGTFDLLIDNAVVSIVEGDLAESFNVDMVTFGDTVVIPRDPLALITMRNGAQFSASQLSVDIESNPGLVDSMIASGSIAALFDNAAVDGNVRLQSQVLERSGTVNTTGSSALTGDIAVTLQNGAALNNGLTTNLVAFGQPGGDGSSAQTGDIDITVIDSTIASGVQILSQSNAEGAVTLANPANVARTGNITFTMSGTSDVSGDITAEHNPFSNHAQVGAGGDAIAGDTTFNFLGGTFSNGRIAALSFVNTAAGGPGGKGGDGAGSNVSMLIDGADVQATGGIVVTTGATAGRGGNDADSGAVTGGDFTLNVLSGSLTASFTRITTDAEFGFTAVGGDGVGANAGNGGTATSGDVVILNDGSGVLSLGDATISTFAQGAYGGYSSAYGGGAGGNAYGGDVTISNRGTGSLTAASLAITASAAGGGGGYSTDGAGGAGGSGFGGTVAVTNASTMNVQDLTIVASGQGGTGGRGSDAAGAGVGGAGTGGAITFSTSTTIAGLNNFSLSATGIGGTGGTSNGAVYGDFAYYGGFGASGGSGQGGSILLELVGEGTEFDLAGEFALSVGGYGGTGGAGGYGYFESGDGGAGGTGTGGALTLAARSGAKLDLTGFVSTLSANGTGGYGGAGGLGGYADGVDTTNGGIGGDGGLGQGGTLSLVGEGGAIVGGDIELTATGTGGRGGAGGPSLSGPGLYSPDGANGGGTGGFVSIQALEGSPGIITLGAIVIDASGLGGGGDLSVPTVGGSIEITDASTDPAGLITLGSLTATALGMVAPSDASFTMSGDSGPITITNDMLVNVVGDIVFDFAGTGQLVVGGSTTLAAGGDILLTHANNTSGVLSIDTGGDFVATAGGSFNAGAGSIANGSGSVSITAQDITYDAIDALGFVRLDARTGSIGFAGTGTITAGTFIDLDAAQAVTIGDADAETGFTIDAGGDVAFGTITNSGGDLAVVAGGSINGVSAINDAPVGSGGLSRTLLTADGDIALTGVAQSVKDGVFLSATGDIVAGAIDAGLNAQALADGAVAVGTVNSGTGALLQGTSVTLDSGSVGGNLVVTATSGSISGSGTIAVGGMADFDAPGSISFGSLTAGTGFTANAGGDIAFDFAGTTGGDLVFAAGGSVLGGDLDVAGLLSVTGTLIRIGNASGTNLSLGSASDILFDSLNSPNSISLVATNGTIGAHAGPGDIDSGGDVSLDARVVSVGNVTSGGSVSANATAGDATFGTIDAATDITVTASGTPSIANAISGGNTSITGASVTFNNGTVGGNLRLNATAGDIDGSGAVTVGGGIDFDATGDIAFGTLEAQGGSFTVDAGGAITFTGATSSDSLTMNAGGAILGGDLDAAGALGLSGASVAIGAASAESIVMTSGSDILFDSLTSATSVILSATSGTIGANMGPGNIDSGGGVSLVAQDIALGDVISGGSVSATATGGDASFGTVAAANDISVTAAGTPTIASAISGGNTSITGTSIVFNSGDVGGTLRLNATAGDIDSTGTVAVGGAIDFDATGNVQFGSLDAGGAFTVDAGGAITFVRATSPVSLTMNAGSAISGGDLDVAGPLSLSGGTIAVGDAVADSIAFASSTDILYDSILVRGPLSLVAAGGAIGANAGGAGDISADGSVSLLAQALALGDLTSGGSLDAEATAGDITFGRVIVAGDIALDAPAGFVSVDHAEAGGDFVANSLTGFATGPNSILTGGDILISTGGAADLGNSNAGGLVDVTAGHIDFVTLVAGGTINLLTQLRPNGPVGDGGIVGTAMTAGAGGSSLDAFGSIAVAGPLDIGGSLSVSAGGSATLGSVDAATSFSGSAGGDFGFASVDATGDVSVSAGGQVGIAAGGTGNITATAGAISISGNAIDVGDLAAGSAVALNASTAVGLGDATAANTISIVAGSDLMFGVITGRDVLLSGGGAISGASVISRNDPGGLLDRVVVSATGDVDIGLVQATDVVDVEGDAVTLGTVSSNNGSVVGTGTVAIGAVSGNGSHSIQGTSVTLGSISIGGGTAAVNATVGAIAVTGPIAAGNVDFDAADNVSFGDATVAGVVDVDAGGSIATGAVTARDIQLTAALDIVSASLVSANATAGVLDRVVLDAGGNISVAGLTRGTDLVTFNAGGAVDAGGILSGGTVTINADSIAIGDAAAGSFALASGSDILFDSLTSNSAVSLTAASGTIGANAGPGDIASNGDVTLLARDIGLGDVTSGGSVGATATTGNASFGTVDAATNISVTAAGTPTVASAISGGNTSITGASVTFNSGDIGGDLSLTATTGSIGSNGTVNVGGAIAFAAPGDVSFGTLAAQGGDFAVSAGGAIGFTAGSANGEIDFAAGGAIAGGSLSAEGAITAAAGSTLTLGAANAGDALDLRAGSTLTLADAIGGTVALRSANGAVIVTNDIDSTFSGDAQQVIVSGAAVQIDDVNDLLLTLVQATDGDIDAVAAGDIGVVAAESAGDINLTSTGGDVRVSLAEAGKTAIVPAGTAGTLAPTGTQVGNPGPGNISILAGGLAQGSFVASGDIGIEAGSTIDLNGADAGGAIALTSGGSTRVFGTAAAGGDIAIASGGDVRVTSSNASLEAGGDLAVQAAGTFDTQGFAYGTNVAVTAGDVVIGDSGKVGDAGQTASVTFTGIGTINVGGDPVAANFSLDANELGRIENSGDLTFRALTGSSNDSDGGTIGTAAVNTSGPARIVIGDMAVAAGSGGQMGSSSTLRLDSQGAIEVLGNLTVAGAGEESALSIRSNGATWLDTAGGNLRIEDGSGAATGIIDIRSASFMAVSADALADIDGLGAADVNARLADNDGVVRSDGFIQAGTLHVRVSDAFFVQNSGEGDSSDLDTRRGFAVDFLSVGTAEDASPLMVINGTVGGQTGLAVLSAADIGSGFAAGSTINGCLIANPAGCIPVAPPPGPVESSFDDPARDLIEENFDPAVELDGDLESMLIDFAPSEQFQDDPLIDDPVTGAGNEDFWVGEPSCEPGSEDEATCPISKEAQPEGQQDEEAMEPAA